MAVNLAADYGSDVKCVLDADELWTEVTGLDVLFQDAIHLITCDLFIDEEDLGYDIRQLLGMPTSKLSAQQPVIAEVLQRDDRIDRADVILKPIRNSAGLHDVELTVTIYTAQGPFTLTRSVSALLETG